METNFLKIYVDLNEKLCRTMVIKSEMSAELQNDYLIDTYGPSMVDLNTPTSWKYYLNIAGEYHVTDTVMTIKSLDDLTTIEFTKDNLAIHELTRNSYRYGTRFYFSLVNEYPDMEQLILGILYPIDIQEAIDATDGTILGYDSVLVEPQEINLIPNLQNFIYSYKVRWDVTAFGISDVLYPAANMAIMYLNVYSKVLSLRLDKCKTNEAHSFHIRQYLASHNRLDRYMNYMTLEQKLFLYRNVLFIENNAGKDDQFNILVDRLLTLRQIPINEYVLQLVDEFDASWYPRLNVKRKQLNYATNIVEAEQFSFELLAQKEIPLADGNKTYYEDQNDEMETLIKTSPSSVMRTKDLESAMVDYNESTPDILIDVFYREWGHKALTDSYRVMIGVTDPRNTAIIIISVKEAFIYAYYLSLISIGIKVVDLPVYISLKHRKDILPTKQELLDITRPDLGYVADMVIDGQPPLLDMLSTNKFEQYATSVFDQTYKHWFMLANSDDLFERSYVEMMIDSLYEYSVIPLDPETNDMTSWLAARNLPSTELSIENIELLMQELFYAATGYSVDKTKLLANIQKAMISILTELKSYTTQTVININDSRIIPTDNPMIRLGDLQFKHLGQHLVKGNVDIVKTSGILKEDVLTRSDVVVRADLNSDYNFNIDTTLDVGSNVIMSRSVSAFNNVQIYDVDYLGIDPILNNTSVVGYEFYLSLSDSDKQLLTSIY